MTNRESSDTISTDFAGTGAEVSHGKGATNTSPEMKSRGKLAGLVEFADRSAWAFVPIWAAAYVAAILPGAQRPLWFDELITYYASSTPSLRRLFATINHVDLNPPLSYLGVRLSMALFGQSPIVVRLTSIFAFFGGSLLIFEFFRRRVGGAFALVGLGIFFCSGFFYYSVEARPYAMLLLFYALAVLSWSVATTKTKWSWAHTGIIAGIGGLILTHAFGPLYGASIGFGELVRTARTRRFDKRVWFAILVPLPLMLTYTWMARPTDLLFPAAFQPTSATAPSLYEDLLRILAPAVGVLVCLALLPIRRVVSFWSVMRPQELAMAVCCYLTPLAIILLTMRSHVAFWPRYAIVMIIPGTLVVVSLFASLSGRRTGIALLGSLALFGIFCSRNFPREKPLPELTDYRNMCPNLPFVVASGVNFIEMDNREPSEMVKRLYYLTDRQAATQFAHATIFESFATIKQWFPVRANVEPYGDFVAQHPYFIVMGDPQYPEDWLLKKLKSDGAQFRDFGGLPTGYSAGILRLFEIRMPSVKNAPPDTCGLPAKETAHK